MRDRILFYGLLNKLTASGFAFSVFTAIVLAFNQLSLFEVSELVQSIWLWIAFYPYAILISILIDSLQHLSVFQRQKTLFTLFLYVFFGFFPFIILMFPMLPYIIIAGIVGSFSASVYFIGIHYVSQRKWLRVVFAIVLPASLLFIALNDFTIKENWQEVKTKTSYEANFTYFEGEHRIPVQLQANDVLTFNIEFHSQNGGGWGLDMENSNGENVVMKTREDSEADESIHTKVEAAKTDTYYIVIRGYDVKGRFVTNWAITRGFEYGT